MFSFSIFFSFFLYFCYDDHRFEFHIHNIYCVWCCFFVLFQFALLPIQLVICLQFFFSAVCVFLLFVPQNQMFQLFIFAILSLYCEIHITYSTIFHVKIEMFYISSIWFCALFTILWFLYSRSHCSIKSQASKSYSLWQYKKKNGINNGIKSFSK